VIDFRYHLVSIVAVFLALAIGIVVGATAIAPTTLAALNKASEHEKKQISSQRTTIRSMQGQINADQALAQSAAPLLLDNLLEGQRVVLVTAPGADSSTINGITSALKQAGAKVTGQAVLQPAFFGTSASTQTGLDALAEKVAPPTITPGIQTAQPDPDTQIAGQQEAATVIAPALVTKDITGNTTGSTGSTTSLTPQQANEIIDGFAAQGFLQLNLPSGSATLTQATLAVVVIPATPPTAGDTDPTNLALISLAQQLSLDSRGVVLAGTLPGSGAGSAIDELINGSTGIQLSSVDDASTETGQVLVAQALSYLLSGKKPSAYGVDTGSVPNPAPTPSATPSASPSPSASPKSHRSGA
jgi:biopolymer transport protein ExbD